MLDEAFDPQNLELWNDYLRHTSIYPAITKAIGQELNLDVHVPRAFKYYARKSSRVVGPRSGQRALCGITRTNRPLRD